MERRILDPTGRLLLPPERPAPSTTWRELALVTGVAVVLGVFQGASVVVGSEAHAGRATAAPASEAGNAAEHGRLDVDPIQGHLWRPAGSTAERPRPPLRPVVWRPAGSTARVDGPVGARALCLPGSGARASALPQPASIRPSSQPDSLDSVAPAC